MSAFPGPYNTYQPSLEASGKLMVDFSRNPAKFPINEYTQIVKVDKNSGLYIRHTADEAARALGETGDQFIWADGSARPDNYIEKEFDFPSYTTRRYAYPFSLGDLTVEQAAWDVVANYSATAAALAMTQRTRRALSKLQDTSIMPDATATALGGGKFDVGTTTNPYLRIGVNNVVDLILQATNGVVQPNDLCIVMNPTDARLIAKSQEVVDFVKSSPFVVDSLKQGSNFARWGLPDYLFGLKLVVEDCVVVTSKKGATRVDTYALTSGNILVLSKVGGIETTNGTFSTCVAFMKEEMTVETYQDAVNRRVIGSVVEDYDYEVVSPISGYLITASTA